MVMTTISYETLKKNIGSELSIEELKNILFEMGMDLDNHEEDELSVEITPERLDILSAEGLGRAIKAFTKRKLESPKYFVHHNEDYEVQVSEKVSSVRPYTVCAVVKNLVLDNNKIKELINIQEKLHQTLARKRSRGAIGIYPMETITWPIKYTADEPNRFSFIPLGETKALTGEEILKYHETGKEYAHLLEGKKLYPYFIDAKDEILSMPPIINSEKTGRVRENTREVFIECSGFEINILNQLLTHLTTMFSDMGGEIYSVKVKYPDKEITSPDLEPRIKTFNPKKVEQIIGLKISEEEIEESLKRMMYEIVNKEPENWILKAPPFRFDLWHEIDIVEDVARAYGYNKIPLTLPNVQGIGGTLPLSDLREELSEVMVGLGFLETYTFAITSKKEQLENMRIDPSKIKFIEIANGQESQGMLRISLLPQQLQAMANNRNRPLPQKIFEGSFVVLPDESKDVKARNEMHFSALITDKIVSFTEIKQVLDALMKTRGLEVNIESTKHPSFIEGRVGKVMLNDEAIGIIGEIHPEVLVNFGLQTPVAVFEINIEKLLWD